MSGCRSSSRRAASRPPSILKLPSRRSAPAGVGHLGLVARRPLGAGVDRERPADERDPLVSGVDQVARQQAGSGLVVDQHRVGPRIAQRTIERHHRDAEIEQAADLRGGGIVGHQDHALDPLLPQHVDVGALLFAALVAVAQEHAALACIRGVFDRAHHLREVRVFDVGDERGDHLDLVSAEVARRPVRAVAELVGRAQHALAMTGFDGRRAVQDARHGRGGNARALGHIGDGY